MYLPAENSYVLAFHNTICLDSEVIFPSPFNSDLNNKNNFIAP